MPRRRREKKAVVLPVPWVFFCEAGTRSSGAELSRTRYGEKLGCPVAAHASANPLGVREPGGSIKGVPRAGCLNGARFSWRWRLGHAVESTEENNGIIHRIALQRPRPRTESRGGLGGAQLGPRGSGRESRAPVLGATRFSPPWVLVLCVLPCNPMTPATQYPRLGVPSIPGSWGRAAAPAEGLHH